ncbi:hypothetical protein H4R34_000497 [Dimargaris verticillata]|uniref:Mini-chromosome maintenance complex-binding protein n=1 Tax=Dimargaris verticillata TaxID=2761393 RepID=A0A9W8BCH2_9FUNG|nr:hypothetical protein H4R34_000497 [Dimargaris verticillata]
MQPTDITDCVQAPLTVLASRVAAATPANSAPQEAEAVQHFCKVFDARSDYDQIPSFNTTTAHAITPGTLVRFRCMVQDPGFGHEMYIKWLAIASPAPGAATHRFIKYTDQLPVLGDAEPVHYHSPDHVYDEKHLCYCVAVPGEQSWVDPLPSHTSATNAPGATDDQSNSRRRLALPDKHLPHQAAPAAVVKFYTADNLPRAAEAIEVMGVFDWTVHGDEDHEIELPCIHALYYHPLAWPLGAPAETPVQDGLQAQQAAMLTYLSRLLGQDDLAAHYLLFALLASTDHTHGLPVGRMVVNLCNFPSEAAADPLKLSPLVEQVAEGVGQVFPFTVGLPLSLDFLNSVRCSPKSDEHLLPGILQTITGSLLLIDETAMQSGQLKDQGVRNVQTLHQFLSEQTVRYEFPYQSIDFATNIRTVIVSEGKSFLPNDCRVPLHTTAHAAIKAQAANALSAPSLSDSTDLWPQWRRYLATCQTTDYTIAPAMAEKIQAEYVQERKQATGTTPDNQATNQGELSLKLTVAKLLAISRGLTTLDDATWAHACDLERERKDRVCTFDEAQRK